MATNQHTAEDIKKEIQNYIDTNFPRWRYSDKELIYIRQTVTSAYTNLHNTELVPPYEHEMTPEQLKIHRNGQFENLLANLKTDMEKKLKEPIDW